MKVLIVAALSVALGFGIGCIPFVQEHLHWNLWFVIPISGLILGMGLGWLQFMGCFVLGTRVTMRTACFFALVAVVAYLATEVGTYFTLKMAVSNIEGIPDGEYRVASLISLEDYFTNRLGAQKIEAGSGGGIEMGATGTTLSFIADLIGAGLGALAALALMIPKYPFCAGCSVFRRRSKLYSIRPHPDQTTLQTVLTSIATVCQAQDHRGLVQLLGSLEREQQVKTSHILITADERMCPKCRESVIVGTVSKQQGNEWKEIADLAFGTSSAAWEKRG